MPDINAQMTFLADIPRYDNEKPYLALITPNEDIDADDERLNNLEWEEHEISVQDIRGREDNYSLETSGFTLFRQPGLISTFNAASDVDKYKRDTESLLSKKMNAVHVHCYDLRLRENNIFPRTTFDLSDPLGIERPAKGAHNDITYKSGPEVIERYLPAEIKQRCFKEGFRFQIVNTWRSLLPVLEDRPLSLCDFRTIEPADLIAADRIFPDKVGEIYYLRYNAKQQWHWLEYQRGDEMFCFITYDTKGGDQARYCPHTSFTNNRASENCQRRRSVETRSIVISTI